MPSFNEFYSFLDYKFRKDEIFKRMKVTTFVQLVNLFYNFQLLSLFFEEKK